MHHPLSCIKRMSTAPSRGADPNNEVANSPVIEYIISINMEKVLNPKERLILIRKGNEIFNNGEIEKAAKIFTTTAYRDGLIRVGDYYYFEKRDIIKALQYYIEANYEKRIREVSERIAGVLKRWLGEPKKESTEGQKENKE
jgi:hypothetical protein